MPATVCKPPEEGYDHNDYLPICFRIGLDLCVIKHKNTCLTHDVFNFNLNLKSVFFEMFSWIRCERTLQIPASRCYELLLMEEILRQLHMEKNYHFFYRVPKFLRWLFGISEPSTVVHPGKLTMERQNGC